MNNLNNKEVINKEINPRSGIVFLIIILLCFAGAIAAAVFSGITLDGGNDVPKVIGGIGMPISVLIMIISAISLSGLKVVGPNEALVLTLFGNYYGTIMKPGFFFVNPFCQANNPDYTPPTIEKTQTPPMPFASKQNNKSGVVVNDKKKTVSLKSMTLDNGTQKVNDIMGNPVIIGAVVIWKVLDPAKAVFNVEKFTEFLSIQTDSTIRNIARLYPYDTYEAADMDTEDSTEKTLRGSAVEIAESMKEELEKRVEFAGLFIEEVRITHLSYAEEIAAAMLQRQQAAAIIAARSKIVDGAVSMVKMAIDKLNDDDIVILDEERKAQMVSNLLVVLCGNKDAQPIVNSGTIY